MSAIDELATLIELSGGVKQPALVAPMGGGKYKVIAGHRRRLASLRLVEQGKEAYRKMPCMVDAGGQEPGADANELRAIDEAILLITTNSQREKTDWDKVQEATRLRALLDRKRQFEKIPGETRRNIAEQLGTTPAQVGRYDSIAKHLIPTFKEWLEQGKIGISVAYELSTLTKETQGEVLAQFWGRREPVTLEDVRWWKQEAEREPPPGESTTITTDETGVAPTPERDEPEPKEEGPKYGPGVYVREMETKHNIASPSPPTEPPAVENHGKVADFQVLPSPAPVPDSAEPEKEPMHERRAAYILEDLQMYCEEMIGIESERAKEWMERATALDMAISALRAKKEVAK